MGLQDDSEGITDGSGETEDGEHGLLLSSVWVKVDDQVAIGSGLEIR